MNLDRGRGVPRAPSPGVSFGYLSSLLGQQCARELLASLPDAEFSPKCDEAAVIDFITAWKVLNANVETSGDEGHRLSGKMVPAGNFELLMASMMQAETLLDGLKRIVSGALILRPDLSLSLSVHLGRPSLTLAFKGRETLARAIYIEALSVVLQCAVLWGLGRPVTLLSVRGPEVVDTELGSVLTVLGRPVRRSGKGVTLVYSAEDAAAGLKPNAFARWHDAAFAEYMKLVNGLTADPGAREQDEVVRRVRACLCEGDLDQASVARRLGLSVPTLRRRLADQGVSFRELLADVRRDAAEVLLLSHKSVEDIAEELGLSDSRCFRRACRAWFGAAPSEVRKTMRSRLAS